MINRISCLMNDMFWMRIFGNTSFKVFDTPFKFSQQVKITSFIPLILSSLKIVNHCLCDSNSFIQKLKISFFTQY